MTGSVARLVLDPAFPRTPTVPLDADEEVIVYVRTPLTDGRADGLVELATDLAAEPIALGVGESASLRSTAGGVWARLLDGGPVRVDAVISRRRAA